MRGASDGEAALALIEWLPGWRCKRRPVAFGVQLPISDGPALCLERVKGVPGWRSIAFGVIARRGYD